MTCKSHDKLISFLGDRVGCVCMCGDGYVCVGGGGGRGRKILILTNDF